MRNPHLALLYNYTGLTQRSLRRLKTLVRMGERGTTWRSLYAGWSGLRHTLDRHDYVAEVGDRRIATDRARQVVRQFGWLVP